MEVAAKLAESYGVDPEIVKVMLAAITERTTYDENSNAPGDVFAQAFRTNLMSCLIPAALDEFQHSYNAIMTGQYGHELVKRSRLGRSYVACKEVVKRHIYCSPEVLRLEIMGPQSHSRSAESLLGRRSARISR